MAIGAGLAARFCGPSSCAFCALNSPPPPPVFAHLGEARVQARTRLKSRDIVSGLTIHADDSRSIRQKSRKGFYLVRQPSQPKSRTARFSHGGGLAGQISEELEILCSSEGKGELGSGPGLSPRQGAAEEDTNVMLLETILKRIKEVATVVALSVLISLPGGGADSNFAFAAESDSSSSSSSASVLTTVDPSFPSSKDSETVRREVNTPECAAARSSNGFALEQSNKAPEPITNESVVDEAWQVVNEYFLDARHHSWSADDWARVREEVLRRPIRSKMAAYGAIKGMLATLNDPYTRFLTPDQFRELAKYDVTGVGLNIGEVENAKGRMGLTVLGIVLGSPAQLMGVRQGDELLAVDGTSVVGMSAFEAASLIQGPKGTPVSIQIRHGPCEDVKSLTVSREQDVRTPVFYRMEHTKDPTEHIGYIRLREFNALARRDLVTAMKKLQEVGATSFLLDLQDNPGGLVQAGIEIARLFLDGGETVIRTVGRDPKIYKSVTATGVPFTRAPLLILVNDHTASASEIVAAALHDNCRAILVGNRTFGKGLIQSVYELSDGSGLILTVGKYVTPGKIDIDGNGIEPDFKNFPGLPEAKQKLGSCTLQLKGNSAAGARL